MVNGKCTVAVWGLSSPPRQWSFRQVDCFLFLSVVLGFSGGIWSDLADCYVYDFSYIESGGTSDIHSPGSIISWSRIVI